MKPQTFVLVHGAWHGGWCWQRVARLLRGQGHEVFTPTLTGLGERAHLLDADVDLATHIADVVNVIRWEGLNHVVLCGHSYAGFVISGVAEQCEAEIAALVFLDAFLPQDNDRMVDITSQATREAIEGAAQRGDIGVPPRPAAFFQVNEKDQAWVDALCTPHPIATMLSPIRLTGARERIARKVYVRARPYPNPGFDAAFARLQGQPGWRVTDVPCGHDVMVDMPERLTELLLAAAPE